MVRLGNIIEAWLAQPAGNKCNSVWTLLPEEHSTSLLALAQPTAPVLVLVRRHASPL